MHRDLADLDRLQSVFIDIDWHFDAAAVGQVVDQPGVFDVAMDDDRLAAFAGVDDM